MWLTITLPKPEQDTWVAPSIKRAKSWATFLLAMERSMAVMIKSSASSQRHVAQHHLGAQNHRARVDVVLARELGRGVMGGFEHGHAVAEVGSRRDAQATRLGRQRVGDTVAAQVRRGDHAVLGRTQQDLLQESVGHAVRDDDAAPGPGVVEPAPRAAFGLTARFLRGLTTANRHPHGRPSGRRWHWKGRAAQARHPCPTTSSPLAACSSSRSGSKVRASSAPSVCRLSGSKATEPGWHTQGQI